MNKPISAALYARVSSDQQAKNKNVESQIELLKERIDKDGLSYAEGMAFIDAGVSGATLIRPELEKLRDSVSFGSIDRIYILSPDRLSRKYAHQVLLLEEFSGAGAEVIFLNHAIGTTPEEELLLQMQGMISEYERAKIMERNRRGKLHRAKSGSVNVLSNAPYGYRYIRKQHGGEPAQYIINLAEAGAVRQIFQWIGIDRMSIGEVCRRLSEAGIKTKTGKDSWDRSVVWGMLQNPVYMGRAAFSKTKTTTLKPRVRPQRHSAEIPKKQHSVERTERKEWIEIPVPALVSEELFLAVQHQLSENRDRARQRRKGAAYLLQGLIVCGHCHYAYYGKKVSRSAAKGNKQYAYYRCIGTDAYRFGGHRVCENKQIRTDRLDEMVWDQVVELIHHPDRLKSEYERRLELLENGTKEKYDTNVLAKQKRNLERGKSRLIDSYTDGLINKDDFEPKISQLKIKIRQLDDRIAESKHNETAQYELFLVVNRIEEFASAVESKLDSMDFNEKREIIRALVKRIEIHHDEVVIVFRVDPERSVPECKGSLNEENNSGESIMQHCKRRYSPDRRQRHRST
ncbi:MAG: recombinase family protein [bacterium]|nr:recombinase family protein [bacterium]